MYRFRIVNFCCMCMDAPTG